MADPGVTSSIPVQRLTFDEVVFEIFSTVNLPRPPLLPIDSRIILLRVVVSYK